MWVRIAGQEALQANHIRAGFVPNKHRTTGTSLNQGNATQDQCPHDPFAEFWLFDHQGAQILGRNKERFHVVDRVDIDERWLAGQLAYFGDELTGPLLHDRGAVPQSIASDHSDRALNQHKHAGSDFSRHEQILARAIAPNLPKTAQTIDFTRLELRKHLLAARIDRRHVSLAVGPSINSSSNLIFDEFSGESAVRHD